MINIVCSSSISSARHRYRLLVIHIVCSSSMSYARHPYRLPFLDIVCLPSISSALHPYCLLVIHIVCTQARYTPPQLYAHAIPIPRPGRLDRLFVLLLSDFLARSTEGKALGIACPDSFMTILFFKFCWFAFNVDSISWECLNSSLF